MTLNPIKAYKQWRTRCQDRKEARFRLKCLKLAMESKDCRITETINRAYVYYVYLKYGVNKNGVEIKDMFRIMRDEVNPPLKPIRL